MATTTIPQFVAITKAEYQPAVSTNDVLLISNINALMKGLQALAASDAGDDARETRRWGESQELLAKESSDDTGAGAEGVVQISDDFAIEHMNHWSG